MESTYTRRHGLRAWEGSDAPHGVSEKGIIKCEIVPTLFRSARMRTYGTLCQQDAMHNDVLLFQWLVACLLACKERGGKQKGARAGL